MVVDQLTNTENQLTSVYELKGIGEEPLAREHIVLECQARRPHEHVIVIDNVGNSTPLHLSVETDLADVFGASSIVIPANQSKDYVLTVTPSRSGTYLGHVSFSESGAGSCSFWYTLEVHAARPDAEGVVALECPVREAVGADFEVSNPLSRAVKFTVLMDGHGLLGEGSFAVEASRSAKYELVFSPLKTGVFEGSLTFVHAEVGEFSYTLRLTGLSAPSIALKPMVCEIGKTVTQTVSLENPIGEEVCLVVSLSNSRNFHMSTETVTIGPYGVATPVLSYSPSSLVEEEECDVKFVNPATGAWHFNVVGSGSPPTVMSDVCVVERIRLTKQSQLGFNNPFDFPISVAVSMDCDGDARGIFELAPLGPECSIPSFGFLRVPFTFSPLGMATYKATIRISMLGENYGRPIEWIYPIRGIAEAPVSSEAVALECKSKLKIDRIVDFVVSGLEPFDKLETFRHTIIIPKGQERVVNAALLVSPVVNTLRSPAEPLRFRFQFAPSVPFKSTLQFLLQKASGGMWRYEVALLATEAEVDDEFEIECTLFKTSGIAFRQPNYNENEASFTASFTPDSSLDFEVVGSLGCG